jgi:N-acetylneuraminic acid mutarotase
MSNAWEIRRRSALLSLLALGTTACPALLEDEFRVVPPSHAGGEAGSDATGAHGGGGVAAGGDSGAPGPTRGGQGGSSEHGAVSAGAGARDAGAAGEQGGIGGEKTGTGGQVGPGGTDQGTAGTQIGAAGGAGRAGSPAVGCPGCDDTCCDGQCVDTAADSRHCGRCGNGCPGTTCNSGHCTNTCLFGYLDCDRNAVTGCEVDAATDPDNCGNCGIHCATNATCEAGVCVCPAGSRDCDGELDNGCEAVIVSDSNNCGACGTHCGMGQACVGGVCKCLSGYDDCNGRADDGCEAALDEPSTCGSCDHDCGAGSTCDGGVCGCADGRLDCTSDPGCESSADSSLTCGNCSTECVGGQVCDGADCVDHCPANTEPCSGSCVDTDSNPQHCGACDSPVDANQQCVDGSPECLVGYGDCTGEAGCETDLQSDPTHCGACDKACMPGAVCASGVCVCAPSMPNDCGNACQECCTAQDCSDGDACTSESCNDGICELSARCAGGGLCCAGQGCYECCGDADCADGEVCSGNQCMMPNCDAGEILCDGSCVDPVHDPSHCGGCGNDCGLGRGCQASSCEPKWVALPDPPAGFTARSGAAAVRCGSRIFIWGGRGNDGKGLDTGAIYDPATDSWQEVAPVGHGFAGRVDATAVWTGQNVVVWGGVDASNDKSMFVDGAAYDPASDSWRLIAEPQTTEGRKQTVGTWTGTRVMFWGGIRSNGQASAFHDLYDPNSDTWTTEPDASAGRLMGAATSWSGSIFYVCGGSASKGSVSDKAYAYDAREGAWSTLPVAPAARMLAFGQWDGSELVVWGGRDTGADLATGFRYEPARNTWLDLSSTGMTQGRSADPWVTGWTARLSGMRVLLLGGLEGSAALKDGAIYNSATNSWASVRPWPSAEEHLGAAAVWSGSEFVLWGGVDGDQATATGERYRP